MTTPPTMPMTATADDRRYTGRRDERDSSRLIVANHYEIDLNRPLGSGGMSIVYLGRDLKARRLVALRTLRPEYRRDHASRARFRQEARRMALIQHPNVARVFDFKENDEAPWAVIEYVPGDSLKDIVSEQGRLDFEVVATYLVQIADALHQLHDRGLVHLDVKPQNLIVTDDGTIKLIDFGLAQPGNNPQELIGGLAYGTAAYLSPEQASGEPVGPASDVYSLGCVMYELLTGQPPFYRPGGDERPNDIIQAHLHEKPAAPSRVTPGANVPAWVDELVLWSLAKRPADRFDDVRLFANLFLEGVEGALTAASACTMRDSKTMPIDTRLDNEPPLTTARGSEPALAHEPRQRRQLVRSVSRSRMPRRIWRLFLALLLANAILAGMLYLQRGAVPGIYDGERPHREGAEAAVIVDGLNVRARPGLLGAPVDVLSAGSFVTITGPAITADAERWWPVTNAGSPDPVAGYVWESGIRPETVTGLDRVEDQIERGIDRVRDSLGVL